MEIHEKYGGSIDEDALVPGEVSHDGCLVKWRVPGTVVTADPSSSGTRWSSTYTYDPELRIDGDHWVWLPESGVAKAYWARLR